MTTSSVSPHRRAARLAQLAAVCCVSLIAITACKASVHIGTTAEVSKADLESKVATQLAAQVNQPTPAVTCPGPLEAKVGASTDCTLVAQGETAKYPVHVVVDNVTNGTVHFTAQVGQTPITGG